MPAAISAPFGNVKNHLAGKRLHLNWGLLHYLLGFADLTIDVIVSAHAAAL